ncbi:hypothetical protein, partial [Streptococcus suis]|uniref:hypothetical protein n=1 Tax=Streptococcus suis TaxID=1307 RepID=UPI001EE6CB18
HIFAVFLEIYLLNLLSKNLTNLSALSEKIIQKNRSFLLNCTGNFFDTQNFFKSNGKTSLGST